MITFTGLLPSFLGYSYYCPILVFQSNAALFETSVLPVEFYYRYYTLKNDHSPSLIRTILWFILSLSFASIPAANTLDKFCPTESKLTLKDYGPYWNPEVELAYICQICGFLGANSATFGVGNCKFFSKIELNNILGSRTSIKAIV
jgi:hypothetical protein